MAATIRRFDPTAPQHTLCISFGSVKEGGNWVFRPQGVSFSSARLAVVEPGPALKAVVQDFLANPPLPITQTKVKIGEREVDHVKAVLFGAAIEAYAQACAEEYPVLAGDLMKKVHIAKAGRALTRRDWDSRGPAPAMFPDVEVHPA